MEYSFIEKAINAIEEKKQRIDALETLVAKFMTCKTEEELRDIQERASNFITVKTKQIIQYYE